MKTGGEMQMDIQGGAKNIVSKNSSKGPGTGMSNEYVNGDVEDERRDR